MRSTITRLALFQGLLIVYCVLFIGLMLKVNGENLASPGFAIGLRNYGFLLLILPLAWVSWASAEANRPRSQAGDGPGILVTGLALLGFLFVIALVGTMSAINRHMVVLVDPSPPPAKIHHP